MGYTTVLGRASTACRAGLRNSGPQTKPSTALPLLNTLRILRRLTVAVVGPLCEPPSAGEMPFSSLLPSPLRLPTPSQPSISAASAYPHASPLRRVIGGSAAHVALLHRLEVRALDAAQVFDYEGQASELLERRFTLKIAVVGFGNFGQFLAHTLAHQGHILLAHSRSDHSEVARSLGVSFRDPHDLCEEHPDVVLLCTLILSTDAVLHSLPMERLHRNTLSSMFSPSKGSLITSFSSFSLRNSTFSTLTPCSAQRAASTLGEPCLAWHSPCPKWATGHAGLKIFFSGDAWHGSFINGPCQAWSGYW